MKRHTAGDVLNHRARGILPAPRGGLNLCASLNARPRCRQIEDTLSLRRGDCLAQTTRVVRETYRGNTVALERTGNAFKLTFIQGRIRYSGCGMAEQPFIQISSNHLVRFADFIGVPDVRRIVFISGRAR